MAFQVTTLPYRTDALVPYISKKTLEFHYGKHYKKYISTLNKLTLGTRFESSSLEEVTLGNFNEDNAIYHNSAQAWNHEFLWNSMSPKKPKPSEFIRKSIEKEFGSTKEFKEKFIATALGLFGSGWVWLVNKSDGSLAIEPMGNAGNPLTKGEVPLLVCDLWEHAYYSDYENDREKYVNQFFQVLNWNFVENNLISLESRSNTAQTQTMPFEIHAPLA